jgi:putative RecB family exonuclease
MDIERLSYSKLSNYLNCPEQFRLTVVEELPDSVGFYHAGGTAVHSYTEARDLHSMGGPPPESWDHYFDSAIAELEELYPTIPKSEWLTTGRGKLVEDETWWRNAGPGLAATWTRWLDASPFMIWVTPDGEPAIELEMNSTFGSVPSLGYVDRVLCYTATPEVPAMVVDIKNGKPPKDAKQLATYADACHQRGWPVNWGGYFMTKGGVLSTYDLSAMIGPQLHYEYDQAWRGIKNHVFPARPSGLCKSWCGVAAYCAWGGKLSDESHLPYKKN